MIISLSGKPGSGKSTVAKKLSADLGYQRHYIGGMRRKMARQKGMTLAEFNKWGEKDKNNTDTEFDEFVENLGKTKDNFIIESRTAFYFIPHSLKIYIDVTPEEGARRIWKALENKSQLNRNEDDNLKSEADVLKSILERIRSDKVRYMQFYQLDIFDKNNYDLFLDVTNMSQEEEYNKVLKFVSEKIS